MRDDLYDKVNAILLDRDVLIDNSREIGIPIYGSFSMGKIKVHVKLFKPHIIERFKNTPNKMLHYIIKFLFSEVSPEELIGWTIEYDDKKISDLRIEIK